LGNLEYPGDVGAAPRHQSDRGWKRAEEGQCGDSHRIESNPLGASGNVAIWFMDGAQVTQIAGIGNLPTVWSIQGANAD
jgi:hypothetical protein